MSLLQYPHKSNLCLIKNTEEYLNIERNIDKFKKKSQWRYIVSLIHTPEYKFNESSLYRPFIACNNSLLYFLPNNWDYELLNSTHQREFIFFTEYTKYIWRRNKKKRYINWNNVSQHFYFPQFVSDFIKEFSDINVDTTILLFQDWYLLFNKHYPTWKVYPSSKFLWFMTIEWTSYTKHKIDEVILAELQYTYDVINKSVYSLLFKWENGEVLLIDWIPLSQLKFFI